MRHNVSVVRGDMAQILRYGLVGVLLTSLYFGLTALIIETLGAVPTISSIVSFVVSVPVAFYLHKHVTFRAYSAHKLRREITRFCVTMTCAFLVSSLIVFFVTEVMFMHYGFAFLLTGVVVPLCNYIVFTVWVFREG